MAKKTLEIPVPSERYINEFINLKCAPELLMHKLFPNAKEITESFSAYNAVRAHLWKEGWQPHDPNILAVCVGDGVVPRTGAVFAYRTKWQVISIDPLMRQKDYNIQRLQCVTSRIENRFLVTEKKVLIVAVHSHARLQACIDQILCPELAIVALPCCVPLELENQPPDIEYRDFNCYSPEDTVKIWKKVNRVTKLNPQEIL